MKEVRIQSYLPKVVQHYYYLLLLNCQYTMYFRGEGEEYRRILNLFRYTFCGAIFRKKSRKTITIALQQTPTDAITESDQSRVT